MYEYSDWIFHVRCVMAMQPNRTHAKTHVKLSRKREEPEVHNKRRTQCSSSSSVSATIPTGMQTKELLGLVCLDSALNRRDFHSVTIIVNCNRITFAVTRISAWKMSTICILILCVALLAVYSFTHLPDLRVLCANTAPCSRWQMGNDCIL